MWVIDTECYHNIWMLCAKKKGTGEQVYFQAPGLNAEELKAFMKSNHTVSFNGIKYDMPMIAHAASGVDNAELKRLSDELITSGKPSWMVCNEEGISVPDSWLAKHIDLIEVAPGMASLKIYGGRLNCPTMQDLPLDPALPVPEDKLQTLIDYCFNDLAVTELLLNTLWPQLMLRDKLSREYGINFRSKSDAQLAEGMIRAEVQQSLGRQLSKPNTKIKSVRYDPPAYVKFDTPRLQNILERILETYFRIHATNGSVCLPEWLADEKIRIGFSAYQFGIGGLHSTEKSQLVRADDNHICRDADVTGFYPGMILANNLAPENMGSHFTRVYRKMVEGRVHAKREMQRLEGDPNSKKEYEEHKTKSDGYKISNNSSFGKFGSMYSMLYSPKLLIQTTITGQLSLLMLIEQLEANGISVVSANTDGIVSHFPKELEATYDEVCFNWMLETDLNLEFTDYKLLASANVNSYVAVKPDGKVKRKGWFAPPGLQKNPDRIIIYDAVSNFLAKGTPLAETIRSCKDITKFVTVRKVTGGAVWRGDELGRAIRFYHSSTVDQEECVTYAKNGNKVPNSDGCRPLMVLPESFPDDVDFSYYEMEAAELLREVGYHG